MTRATLAPPKERLAFDGERASPWLQAPMWAEHLHRYLSVLGAARDRRVLDIACGEGYGAALMARMGAAQVVGVDRDAEIVARANRLYTGENLHFEAGSITEPLPFPDAAFDLVTCFETIEHVSAQAAAIAGLARVLAPGGILAISTPDAAHPRNRDTDNPFHEKELTEAELRALLAPHFPHVAATYQRSVTGSMIVDADGRLDDGQAFWERDGFAAYDGGPGLAQPVYLLFWASDGPLPRPPTGLLHDGVLGTLINQTLRRDGMEIK